MGGVVQNDEQLRFEINVRPLKSFPVLVYQLCPVAHYFKRRKIFMYPHFPKTVQLRGYGQFVSLRAYPLFVEEALSKKVFGVIGSGPRGFTDARVSDVVLWYKCQELFVFCNCLHYSS